MARDPRSDHGRATEDHRAAVAGAEGAAGAGLERKPNRFCLEGILWVLRSGARWKGLPERYPSPSTR